MILYRAVGLQEAGLMYDAGMRAFPAGLPQQPIFYPVLQLEYARQTASDWNVRNGELAGYVTKFTVDDQYIGRFEEHSVGDTSYQELWIPADELEEFNKHISGRIKVVEAYFGDAFQGFIPDKNQLQGKNAVDQFTLLTSSYLYKRMEFFLEVRRNHKAVFLNYPFWQKYTFKNPGLKEKILKAIKEAWMTAFPEIPLVNYVQEVNDLTEEDEQTPDEPEQEDDSVPLQKDLQPLAHPLPMDRTPRQLPEPNPKRETDHPESRPGARFSSNLPADPVMQQPGLVEPRVSHFEQGVKLGLSDKFREATGELSKAVEVDPRNAAAFTSLGVAYHKLGEDARALSCYEKALKIDAKYAEAHYFRANIFYAEGNDREAIAGYSAALGLNPELIEAHQHSVPQDRLTDYTSAPAELYRISRSAHRILDLNKRIEASPRQAELFKERAAEYERLLNYEQAVADYTSSLTLQPRDANVLLLRGAAHEKLRQRDRALQDYQQANAVDPQLANEYINRGIAFANAGNFRQAVISLTDGMRLAPKNPDIYFNRGVSYFQSGDLENAIRDFSNVIELSPNDEDAYYWRGITYEGSGRRPEAQTDYARFLELSQNELARRDVEQRLKQWDEGRTTAVEQRADPNDGQRVVQVEAGRPKQEIRLSDLIAALDEKALRSTWFASEVECSGDTADELLSLVSQKRLIPGRDLRRIASGIREIAEGDFVAFDPGSSSHWILIRAWQGRGFYIEVNDPQSSQRLKTSFQLVEKIEGPNPAYESLFVHTSSDPEGS